MAIVQRYHCEARSQQFASSVRAVRGGYGTAKAGDVNSGNPSDLASKLAKVLDHARTPNDCQARVLSRELPETSFQHVPS